MAEQDSGRRARGPAKQYREDEDSDMDNYRGGKKKDIKPKTPSDGTDKKRGRPSKEIAWDPNYNGPLRRCAYIGHDELWGPDVPADLQPQYFYSTTARCIYCYKHLCNERHANKTKGGGSTKKKGRGRRVDDYDNEDDEVVTPSQTKRSRSSSRKRSKAEEHEEEWSNSSRRYAPSQSRATPANHPPPNVLHNAETAQIAHQNGPKILQDWVSPPVATLDYASFPEGSSALQIKLGGVPSTLEVGRVLRENDMFLLNSTPLASCVGWINSDMVVVGGGSTLFVWSGLLDGAQARLLYSLQLEGGAVVSFIVLPRSGVEGVRVASVAAIHADGRMRLHSLPVSSIAEQGDVVALRQLGASPVSAASNSPVQSLAVSTHPSHPNRLIVGHQDGSLRWIDLPSNPGPELPAFEGNGGAGFSVASAGYLPTSDAAFWAVGDSASVAIGDIREPFGGPVVPPSSGAHTEAYLKTADSSIVFPALIAGGDGGHVWALPWAGEHTPPPRLLCSLNGSALSIQCHPFLPVALTGCGSGAARALWLPAPAASRADEPQQVTVHSASVDDRSILVDAPADLNDNGFRSGGNLACVSVDWAPDVEGRYAIVHSNGLVKVGNVREFVLNRAK